MQKLSNSETELKKSTAYKKACISIGCFVFILSLVRFMVIHAEN